jgi:hypothetical protein
MAPLSKAWAQEGSRLTHQGDEPKRAGGGGKLSRSETVTVRLDPKLRYLAELAARKHRRTLSSFIEWAIEESLTRIRLGGDSDLYSTVSAEAELLWDVDEADRFAKLALRHPHMLTHEEQVVWKLVRENGFLWKGNYNDDESGEWTWSEQETDLLFERLREHLSKFKAVARGEADKSQLPNWPRQRPASGSSEA